MLSEWIERRLEKLRELFAEQTDSESDEDAGDLSKNEITDVHSSSECLPIVSRLDMSTVCHFMNR